MKKILTVLKQYYFILILIPILSIRLGGFDIWFAENLIIRIVLIPLMILIIYLALSNTHNEIEEVSFSRIRWKMFDIGLIILSLLSICQTLYYIVNTIITD